MSIRIKFSAGRILAQMPRNKLKLNVKLVEMSFLSNVGTRKVSSAGWRRLLAGRDAGMQMHDRSVI